MPLPLFQDHRAHVDVILRAALRAADPAEAVRRGWPQAEIESARRVRLVAVGKAGVRMAQAAAELLGSRLERGLVAAPAGVAPGLAPRLDLIPAGHPLPTDGSLRAGQLAAELLAGLAAHDLALVLLSGGGSALFEHLAPGLTLDDLQALNALLLRSGAPIQEVNCVRKHLSRVKGGGLARLAAPARVAALILSDVVGDPLDVIASGPTVPDPTTVHEARVILRRYRINLPKIEAALAETPKPGDPVFARVLNRLVGSNALARQAAAEAARELGFDVALPPRVIQGEAREIGREIAREIAREIEIARESPRFPRAEIFGGESTVTVRGRGVGGRNQELALAAAIELRHAPGRIVIASFGTDGVDGPTPAAGAVVTPDTARQAAALGLDLDAALAENDSHTALARLGATLVTGLTGTNVNDLVLALAYPA